MKLGNAPIEVEGLHYRYPGGERDAVAGIGFAVQAGEIFGFLGPSGAGKSTTQKVLTGLLAGYEGTVRVLGRDVSSWGTELYERIGVSFELPNHFSRLTGRENLEFFARLYAGNTRDPDRLLGAVGLQEAADVRVGEYSKGMKNRLGVARALLPDTDLLFLDEPTAGLDPVNARRIREIVAQQRSAGRTTFLTTHDMVTADELCDRVALIVDGEIVATDAPRALKLQHGRRTVRVEWSRDGARRVQEFPLDGLGDDAEFLERLRGETIETIHSQEATLEQVFVNLTGRGLS